jgi:hypothetical protein
MADILILRCCQNRIRKSKIKIRQTSSFGVVNNVEQGNLQGKYGKDHHSALFTTPNKEGYNRNMAKSINNLFSIIHMANSLDSALFFEILPRQ